MTRQTAEESLEAWCHRLWQTHQGHGGFNPPAYEARFPCLQSAEILYASIVVDQGIAQAGRPLRPSLEETEHGMPMSVTRAWARLLGILERQEAKEAARRKGKKWEEPDVTVRWREIFADELEDHAGLAHALEQSIERAFIRAKLTPIERQVLRAWFDGESQRQTAKDLKIRPSAVAELRKTGLAALREREHLAAESAAS